jgi:hypothetical protein
MTLNSLTLHRPVLCLVAGLFNWPLDGPILFVLWSEVEALFLRLVLVPSPVSV